MIKSYLGPFVLTFFISIFLLLMQFLWKYIDELVGKGLELQVIAELMAYASASFIPMALPLAILLSSIMTFGNLGEHYELVALKSSGISLTRIMKPLVAFTLLLSVLAFLFSNYYLPYANLKFYSLLFDVREQRPEILVKQGVFYDGIDDFSIRINGRNKNTKMMYGLYIFDHRDRMGNNIIIIADSGQMDISKNKQYIILDLYDGKKYEEVKSNNKEENQGFYPHQIDEFKSQRSTIELEGFAFSRTDESLFKEHYHMLNVQQLGTAVDSLIMELDKRNDEFLKSTTTPYFLKVTDSALAVIDSNQMNAKYKLIDSLYTNAKPDSKKAIIANALSLAKSQKSYVSSSHTELKARKSWISKHEIQWHLKFSLSVACLILFFIGAPLGAIIRKGGLGLPVVVAILFFIFYYIISITGEKFAKEDVLPAAVGVWMSSAILLPIGVFLTYKAARESNMFNIENYLKPIIKIINFVFRKKK